MSNMTTLVVGRCFVLLQSNGAVGGRCSIKGGSTPQQNLQRLLRAGTVLSAAPSSSSRLSSARPFKAAAWHACHPMENREWPSGCCRAAEAPSSQG